MPAPAPDASPSVGFASLTLMWALDNVTGNWCGHLLGDIQYMGLAVAFSSIGTRINTANAAVRQEDLPPQ